MANWSEGYISDINYTYGYYRDHPEFCVTAI